LPGYRYDYRYRRDRDWVYVTSDRICDFDLGVDAVIGMEYRFSNNPQPIFKISPRNLFHLVWFAGVLVFLSWQWYGHQAYSIASD
jgi:hypothetical protein